MRRVPKDMDGKPVLPPKIKPFPLSVVVDGEKVSTITEVRAYRLITPMFGGGAREKRADGDMVVRGSAIRGQLRFWWRATQWGRFNGDLKNMKEKEGLLWGAASTPQHARPSRVSVEVRTTNNGVPKYAYVMRGRPGRKPTVQAQPDIAPSYVSFPLQPTREEINELKMGAPIHPVLDGVEFELSITYPETNAEEIQAALWAWEIFGGVGGRTRRGFGALRLLAIDGKPVELSSRSDVYSDIIAELRKHVKDGPSIDNVPRLSKNSKIAVSRASKDSKTAWNSLIEYLKKFRQARYPGTRSPGRSKWPEPDEIRRLTDSSSPRHSKRLSKIEKFPRAAFGLPIRFQFKDSRLGDPHPVTLEGTAEYVRFASPLILRPLVCKGGAVGLALILEGTDAARIPSGLRLKGAQDDPQVHSLLTKKEAKQIEPLAGNPDVLDAFLNYVKEEEKR